MNQSIKQTQTKNKQTINKISFPKFDQASSLVGCSAVWPVNSYRLFGGTVLIFSEYWGTTLIRNFGSNLKVDTAYHPKRRVSLNETVLKRNRSIALCGERSRCGRGCGPVVRQTAEWMNTASWGWLGFRRTTEGSGFNSRQGNRLFLFSKAPRPAVANAELPIQ